MIKNYIYSFIGGLVFSGFLFLSLGLFMKSPLGTSFGGGGGSTSIGNGGFDSLLVSHGGTGNGTTATTTSTFGDTSTTTSASCFTLKTNLGATVKAYIVGTSWVIAANACD